MRLSNILIENFKSIKSLELKFSDNLYCLIGKNEIGKSNILQAISVLGDIKDIQENKYKQEKLKRILKLSNIVADYQIDSNDKELLKPILQSFRRKAGTVSSSIRQQDAIRFQLNNLKSVRVIGRKSTADENNIQLVLNDGSTLSKNQLPDPSLGNNYSKTISSLLPSIEYFEKEDFLIRAVTPNELMTSSDDPSLQSFKRVFALGGVNNFEALMNSSVEEIIELREAISLRLNQLLRKYYKQDKTLNVKIESHDGSFSLHFKDDYYKHNSLEDRSTGFQYFFAFLINKIYLKEFGKKNSIYLLDEPALSLHPTGQKDFIKLLEEISSENQILYTTHSPFSINRMKPTSVWVIEKTVERGTFLNPKPYQKNWRPLRSALGIDISDSFFYGDKSLLVEGPEDRLYIGALLNHFSEMNEISLNSDLLSIIDSGSISNMPAMVQILIDEERPLFILIDGDDNSIYNRLKKKEQDIANKELFSLRKTSDIFEGAVSIEDLIPHALYIKAVDNYLKFLMSEKTIALSSPETPLPNFESVKSPKKYQSVAAIIIDHFKNSDGSNLDNKVPISKVGIAHEFEKLLKDVSKIGTDEEEKICLDLIKLIVLKLNL
jgi:predicted ATP-dependent endonuclease of OLD family